MRATESQGQIDYLPMRICRRYLLLMLYRGELDGGVPLAITAIKDDVGYYIQKGLRKCFRHLSRGGDKVPRRYPKAYPAFSSFRVLSELRNSSRKHFGMWIYHFILAKAMIYACPSPEV